MEEQFYTIVLRHDTSTMWLVNDPILSLGEYGVEDDTHKVKRGDGESKWSELTYEDFGLQYIVTFANLHGDLKDNETLTEEFEKKLSKKVFNDVDNAVVVSIDITNDSEDNLGKITKRVKEINLGGTTTSNLLITSSDKSIQGIWSIDELGARTLNLKSKATINDYEPGRTYNRDYICYYGNKLYRAVETFEAEETFEPRHWALLGSLHSSDIKYDNLSSGLDAENVKDALDELKRRDDRKVTKSTEERIVYGTDRLGQQTVISIDDLRKVDTVNHKQADINKNVQLDASEIKYSDANPELGTIREVLDEKVDKDFAGHNAKIVRDIRTEYDEETGHIKIIEDKVSPRDGTSDTEIREIDVVAEAELLDNVNRINTRIDTEVQTLNDRVDDEVETLNTTINTKETAIYNKIQEEHDEINDRVDSEVSTLNTRIDTEVQTLNDRIDNEVTTLNGTINDKEAALYRKIQDEHNEINARVTDEVATLNNTINTKEAGLQQQIDLNASEIARVESERTAEDTRIETESKTRDNQLDTKINQAVNTLNNTILRQVDILNETIDTKEQTMNDRVDTEVQTLNDRINDEVETLNNTIQTEKTAMDNKKIDKDLSTLLVTEIEADVDASTNEPTMKITRKNTTTKESVVNHLHFKAKGNIQTRFVDADHIEIDSSAIDGINTEQNRRLGIIDTRLNAHDTDIASLQEHDVAHDNMLATHTSQIAQHEQRIHTNETNITELDRALNTEKTTRQNMDDALSARITTNAVEITTKADKEFADTTGDKVVGKLESDTIRNNEIFNLKETMVSPVDNSSSVERLKVISSDNTVIATRLADGTIDIATNLDTDVNYFVTTDIINTTIASETVLDMANLTPTDKQEVEIQDIISDPEGTWGRVKSIDTENNTCTVVTFKKHTQAVWGTIKGNIADQQDLQEALDNLGDTKVDKTTTSNQVYGTNENGEQTTFNKDDLRKVDTVNGVQADANKNVEITANDIFDNFSWYEDPQSIKSIIEDLYVFMQKLFADAANRIRPYTPANQYTVRGELVDDNFFVIFTRDDGVMLMAKVMNDFIADNSQPTPYESFMYDVEQGNLKLVGIPEQQGDDTPTPQPSWELYTSVNIESVTSSDGQHPIAEVYQDTNGVYNVGFNFLNNSQNDNMEISGVYSTEIGYGSTGMVGLNLENDYTYYDNESAILEELNFSFVEPAPEPDWRQISNIGLSEPTSSDGVAPVVEVWKDFNDIIPDTRFQIPNGSSVDLLTVRYIPDDLEATINVGDVWAYESSQIDPDSVDQAYIENNFEFIWEQVDENEQAFNILNDVMGTSDDYDGLGGTEEEVEEILDEILGNDTSAFKIKNITFNSDYNADRGTTIADIEVENGTSPYTISYISDTDETDLMEYEVVDPDNNPNIIQIYNGRLITELEEQVAFNITLTITDDNGNSITKSIDWNGENWS